ncbi:alcohol dehydrogenase catalytic domain-containing protein [Moritella sp. 36]|uniref:alcohol dehydrogenase catalytic domain-containing protein n=1 Tax=Moritella sp. 36 TaxID=2746233 RepID=UPI001BAC9466|nr:alcohol dehydrogenase catalytic domain-containing protein [Moritella sp. 36]QUM88870.1 alcohol dehydrogenase catalytic domain-containing protein [Moritella sp. 36]
MKAYVFDGKESAKLEDRPIPTIIKQSDVIVKVEKTTICGTDLHILRNNVATFIPGTIMGHEGVGIVESCGDLVSKFKTGDRVIISCITSCGSCKMCQVSKFGQCFDGGWLLGNEIDGCQAEYVRIPFGDTSLHLVPKDIDTDSLVLLSDIFPTGYEVGVLDGQVKPGCSVAVIGCGPVGLSSLMTSKFFSPSEIYAIDTNDHRLQVATELGATHAINNSDGTAVQQILDITDGVGVDVVIEAIGIPAGWDMSQKLVCPGGNIAVLGVHGKSATINLEDMWKRNFTMTAGMVHTNTIPMLIKQIRAGHLEPKKLISHQFKLSESEKAYTTFTHASDYKSLKVIISNDLL